MYKKCNDPGDRVGKVQYKHCMKLRKPEDRKDQQQSKSTGSDQ